MTEVIDIFSGKQVRLAYKPQRPSSIKKIAKANDRFRKHFSWRTEMEASEGFMQLQHDVLADVLFQLKRAKYNRIGFGCLSKAIISSTRKNRANAEHSSGVINAGKPVRHIVWKIDRTNRKIALSLASEIFGN